MKKVPKKEDDRESLNIKETKVPLIRGLIVAIFGSLFLAIFLFTQLSLIIEMFINLCTIIV